MATRERKRDLELYDRHAAGAALRPTELQHLLGRQSVLEPLRTAAAKKTPAKPAVPATAVPEVPPIDGESKHIPIPTTCHFICW